MKSTKGSFFKRGATEAHTLAPNEGKTMFTTMFCCNAAGDLLPPYVVYKGTPDIIQSTWVKGGPTDTAYSVSRSGWMEDYVLESWFKMRFVKWLDLKEIQRPVMLIFDGHGSHITYHMAQIAQENGVCLYCLPPHTSSKLQPLDVGVYAPLKKWWRSILDNFYSESRLHTVTKAVFPSLLKKLFSKLEERPGNIVNAFAACGLCPFNKHAIPEDKLISSIPFERKESSNTNVTEPSREETHLTPSASTSSRSISGSIRTPQTQNLSDLPSPRKTLRAALCEVISPPQSQAISSALTNSKAQRKRVQKAYGECLTEQETIDRLQQEMKDRDMKKKRTAGQIIKSNRGRRVKRSLFKPSETDFESTDNLAPQNQNVISSDDSDNGEEFSTSELLPIKIVLNNKNKFVAAVYDGRWYLALVEDQYFEQHELQLKFMHPHGPSKHFFWPDHEDTCILPVSNILALLRDPPTPTNARASQFIISGQCSDEIEAKFRNN